MASMCGEVETPEKRMARCKIREKVCAPDSPTVCSSERGCATPTPTACMTSKQHVRGGNPADVYRLGDIASGYLRRHVPPGVNLTRLVCTAHPMTIGCRYLRKASHDKDWTTFWSIVDTSPSPSTPSNTTLVVHLRLGDVLDWPYYRNRRGCSATSGCYYVRPLRFYEAFVLRPWNATDVVLVGNPAYRARGNESGTRASVQYLTAVKRSFERRGLPVRLRTTSTPDADFLYMCRASLFLCSLGGYASLAAECVRRRGGTVFSSEGVRPGTARGSENAPHNEQNETQVRSYANDIHDLRSLHPVAPRKLSELGPALYGVSLPTRDDGGFRYGQPANRWL